MRCRPLAQGTVVLFTKISLKLIVLFFCSLDRLVQVYVENFRPMCRPMFCGASFSSFAFSASPDVLMSFGVWVTPYNKATRSVVQRSDRGFSVCRSICASRFRCIHAVMGDDGGGVDAPKGCRPGESNYSGQSIVECFVGTD